MGAGWTRPAPAPAAPTGGRLDAQPHGQPTARDVPEALATSPDPLRGHALRTGFDAANRKDILSRIRTAIAASPDVRQVSVRDTLPRGQRAGGEFEPSHAARLGLLPVRRDDGRLSRLDPGRPRSWIREPSATSNTQAQRVEPDHGPRRPVVVLVD